MFDQWVPYLWRGIFFHGPWSIHGASFETAMSIEMISVLLSSIPLSFLCKQFQLPTSRSKKFRSSVELSTLPLHGLVMDPISVSKMILQNAGTVDDMEIGHQGVFRTSSGFTSAMEVFILPRSHSNQEETKTCNPPCKPCPLVSNWWAPTMTPAPWPLIGPWFVRIFPES